MNKNIGQWAIDNKKLLYFLFVVLFVGGILSAISMPKLEDPEIKVKQALVVTVYPGASAHQVELEVTDMLEKSIRSMKHVEAVESRSMNDVSIIQVSLSTLLPDNEVEQYWDILRRKVTDVQHNLPQGIQPSVVMDDFGDVYGLFYAITNDGFTDAELENYIRLIKRELLSIEGVSRIETYAQRNRSVYIEINEDRMAMLGVPPTAILSTLKGQNQTVYAGYFDGGDQRLRVTVNDKYNTVEDIGNLIIQGFEDDQLKLNDLARVYEDYEPTSRNLMRYDGTPAVGLLISSESGTDITKVGHEVEKKLESLKNNRLPKGIEYHKVFFQSDRVKQSLNTFMKNLIESVLIVIFVLMLTMGFRSGVIIGSSLLLIVLGSFVFLNLFDGTLQRVSLGAFILAMGMLVDNAIVIIDGILVDMKRGVPQKDALTGIVRRTAIPLLGATLIAILAFFPIYLSPDTAGVYVRDLFIVLAISLLLSWLLALTQVPLQASFALKVKPNVTTTNRYDGKLYKVLRKTLLWSLSHKIITIAIALVFIFLSVLGYRYLPKSFFPDMDYDQLYIEYKLPESYGNKKVDQDLRQIEQKLMKRKDVKHVTTSIGGTPGRYNLVRSINDPSLSYGELIVDFSSSKALVKAIDTLQAQLSAEYPDAYVRLKRYNLMYKKYPIEVEFRGPDPAILRALTAQAQAIMNTNPKTALVTNDWGNQTPLIEVQYNQPTARQLGISRPDVGLSLLAATDGIPAEIFYDGSRRQSVYLCSVDANGNKIEALNNIPAFSMLPSLTKIDKEDIQGLMLGTKTKSDILSSLLSTVPMSQAVSGFSLKWENPIVIRRNGQRAMRAQCNTASGVGAEEAREAIAAKIELIPLPEGYSMEWEGEYGASKEANKYLFKNFPLAIILMIGILILLFKDYKKPIIILLCIPLILIGVVAGVLISGKSFGFVAIVGVLGLIGMMIKNGIVLMDEISIEMQSNPNPIDALLNSSSSRFRPVMMASFTTILGMIPLLSDDMFGSLAVTIMGGLFMGTLIILIFIPVLYAVFFRVQVKKDHRKSLPES